MSTTLAPIQVQRQAEQVEQIERDLAEIKNPTSGTPDPATITDPPAETPSSAPQVPAAPLPTPPKTEESVLQQRFNTLQGKYNAEVPRLTAEVRSLKAQLKDALAARVEPTVDKSKLPELKITSKDVETFGTELLDVVKRQAQDIMGEHELQLQAHVQKLEADNTNLKQQLTGVAEKQGVTDEQTFLTKLAQAVPDWEQCNVDPGFLAWLGEIDPLSGSARQTYLDDAASKLDAHRTAQLFNAWKGTAGTPAPPPPMPVSAKPDVQSQVAPGKSKSSAAPGANPADRIWSLNEIEEFYQDVRKGVYAGKLAESQKIEAEIDLAVASGRLKQ